jgi:hypothetical protein
MVKHSRLLPHFVFRRARTGSVCSARKKKQSTAKSRLASENDSLITLLGASLGDAGIQTHGRRKTRSFTLVIGVTKRRNPGGKDADLSRHTAGAQLFARKASGAGAVHGGGRSSGAAFRGDRRATRARALGKSAVKQADTRSLGSAGTIARKLDSGLGTGFGSQSVAATTRGISAVA